MALFGYFKRKTSQAEKMMGHLPLIVVQKKGSYGEKQENCDDELS